MDLLEEFRSVFRLAEEIEERYSCRLGSREDSGHEETHKGMSKFLECDVWSCSIKQPLKSIVWDLGGRDRPCGFSLLKLRC